MKVITTPQEKQDRLDTCHACDKFVIKATLEVCGACNCPLATKTSLVLSKCPLDKWKII